jgi:hypothetical protein
MTEVAKQRRFSLREKHLPVRSDRLSWQEGIFRGAIPNLWQAVGDAATQGREPFHRR